MDMFKAPLTKTWATPLILLWLTAAAQAQEVQPSLTRVQINHDGRAPVVHAPSSGHPIRALIQKPIEGGPVESDPESVIAYWTKERMKNAEMDNKFPPGPIESPYWPGVGDAWGYLPVAPPASNDSINPYPGNAIARINGILFFVEDNTKLAHCSASIIQSHSRDLLLTAAHCVRNAAGWHTNVMFVPAYNGKTIGSASIPFGKWIVKQAFIPYSSAYASEDDIAVIRLYANQTHDNKPLHIEDAVGLGLVPRLNTEEESFPLVDIYGYPGVNLPEGGIEHDGQQFHCLSLARPSLPDDGNASPWMVTPQCNLVSGSSGGPSVIAHLDGSSPEVVAVVHFQQQSSRLTPTYFPLIFEAADGALGLYDQHSLQ